MPYAKNFIKVKVPRKSGFDKSHRNSGTGKCGTLIPLLCDEVIPNTRVHLRVPLVAQMPPLASETYMNVKLKLEAFFVPMRLLCGSFESWFTDVPVDYRTSPSSSSSYTESLKGRLPVLRINTDDTSPAVFFSPGSLGDYLGFGAGSIDTDSRGVDVNLLPFLAYHLVYNEYYRNPRVQKSCFIHSNKDHAVDNGLLVASVPFDFLHGGGTYAVPNFMRVATAPSDLNGITLADGFKLFELRQRNFGLDYFTGSRVDAQQGDAVRIDIPQSGDNAHSFSIAALRAGNSLQQFRERNNLPSPRLIDQVKARYGAILSDGVAQRPICIGSATLDMNTRGVDQTAAAGESQNPFTSVASQYGRASVAGSDLIIKDFTANEPGYIMVLMSQVPEVSYTYGVDRKFMRYTKDGSIVEMATPLLQNMGDQPIMVSEVSGLQVAAIVDSIFGYQDRFADFMFCKNQIHGLFRDGQSLASFVAQRALGSSVELSSAFLQIPTNYLDDVLATSEAVSGLTYWYDAYLDYKVSMPLAEFSIPSLQDPAYEHGETVSLRRNGQIF